MKLGSILNMRSNLDGLENFCGTNKTVALSDIEYEACFCEDCISKALQGVKSVHHDVFAEGSEFYDTYCYATNQRTKGMRDAFVSNKSKRIVKSWYVSNLLLKQLLSLKNCDDGKQQKFQLTHPGFELLYDAFIEKTDGLCFISELHKLPKNRNLSQKLRIWGNEEFKKRHFIAAKCIYTAALALCPTLETESLIKLATGNRNIQTSLTDLLNLSLNENVSADPHCVETGKNSAAAMISIILSNLSAAYLQLGEWCWALRTANEGIRLWKNNSKAWHRRAKALLGLREEVAKIADANGFAEEYFETHCEEKRSKACCMLSNALSSVDASKRSATLQSILKASADNSAIAASKVDLDGTEDRGLDSRQERKYEYMNFACACLELGRCGCQESSLTQNYNECVSKDVKENSDDCNTRMGLNIGRREYHTDGWVAAGVSLHRSRGKGWGLFRRRGTSVTTCEAVNSDHTSTIAKHDSSSLVLSEDGLCVVCTPTRSHCVPPLPMRFVADKGAVNHCKESFDGTSPTLLKDKGRISVPVENSWEQKNFPVSEPCAPGRVVDGSHSVRSSLEEQGNFRFEFSADESRIREKWGMHIERLAASLGVYDRFSDELRTPLSRQKRDVGRQLDLITQLYCCKRQMHVNNKLENGTYYCLERLKDRIRESLVNVNEAVCAGCMCHSTPKSQISGSSWSSSAGNEAYKDCFSSRIFGIIPCLPCDFCTGVFFCCEVCKLSSVHWKVCRTTFLHQTRYVRLFWEGKASNTLLNELHLISKEANSLEDGTKAIIEYLKKDSAVVTAMATVPAIPYDAKTDLCFRDTVEIGRQLLHILLHCFRKSSSEILRIFKPQKSKLDVSYLKNPDSYDALLSHPDPLQILNLTSTFYLTEEQLDRVIYSAVSIAFGAREMWRSFCSARMGNCVACAQQTNNGHRGFVHSSQESSKVTIYGQCWFENLPTREEEIGEYKRIPTDEGEISFNRHSMECLLCYKCHLKYCLNFFCEGFSGCLEKIGAGARKRSKDDVQSQLGESSSHASSGVTGGEKLNDTTLPVCLFALALHCICAAICNSFKIRTFESASRVNPAPSYIGTALYLKASRINHSCCPNAAVRFGLRRKYLRDYESKLYCVEHQKSCLSTSLGLLRGPDKLFIEFLDTFRHCIDISVEDKWSAVKCYQRQFMFCGRPKGSSIIVEVYTESKALLKSISSRERRSANTDHAKILESAQKSKSSMFNWISAAAGAEFCVPDEADCVHGDADNIEEICVSYGPEAGQPFSDVVSRVNQLRNLGFICQCLVCTSDFMLRRKIISEFNMIADNSILPLYFNQTAQPAVLPEHQQRDDLLPFSFESMHFTPCAKCQVASLTHICEGSSKPLSENTYGTYSCKRALGMSFGGLQDNVSNGFDVEIEILRRVWASVRQAAMRTYGLSYTGSMDCNYVVEKYLEQQGEWFFDYIKSIHSTFKIPISPINEVSEESEIAITQDKAKCATENVPTKCIVKVPFYSSIIKKNHRDSSNDDFDPYHYRNLVCCVPRIVLSSLGHSCVRIEVRCMDMRRRYERRSGNIENKLELRETPIKSFKFESAGSQLTESVTIGGSPEVLHGFMRYSAGGEVVMKEWRGTFCINCGDTQEIKSEKGEFYNAHSYENPGREISLNCNRTPQNNQIKENVLQLFIDNSTPNRLWKKQWEDTRKTLIHQLKNVFLQNLVLDIEGIACCMKTVMMEMGKICMKMTGLCSPYICNMLNDVCHIFRVALENLVFSTPDEIQMHIRMMRVNKFSQSSIGSVLSSKLLYSESNFSDVEKIVFFILHCALGVDFLVFRTRRQGLNAPDFQAGIKSTANIAKELNQSSFVEALKKIIERNY